MEHTKGDWHILRDGLTIMAKIEYEPHHDAEPPQSLIAKCFQNGHLGRTKRPTKEDLANAKLIAAAPQLLAACKLFLGHKPLDEIAHLLKLNYKDVLKAKTAVEAAN